MAMKSVSQDGMVEPHRDQAIAHMEQTEHAVEHNRQPRPQRRYRCRDCPWNDGSPEWQ